MQNRLSASRGRFATGTMDPFQHAARCYTALKKSTGSCMAVIAVLCHLAVGYLTGHGVAPQDISPKIHWPERGTAGLLQRYCFMAGRRKNALFQHRAKNGCTWPFGLRGTASRAFSRDNGRLKNETSIEARAPRSPGFNVLRERILSHPGHEHNQNADR